MPRHRLPRMARTLGAATLATILAACASDDQQTAAPPDPDRILREAPPWDAGDRPISEVLSSARAASGDARPTELVSRQRLDAAQTRVNGADPTMLGEQPGELIRVKYTTRDAEPADVLRVLLGEYLGRDYVLAPDITGNVTMDVDQEMTRSDIMDMVGGLCMVYGWSMEDRDGTVIIRPANEMARADSIPIMQARAAINTDTPAIRVRTLRYVEPGDLSTLLPQFMSGGAKVASVGRTLVMVDTIRQLNKVSDLLGALDVAEFDGVEIWTYRLGSRTPDEAVDVLTQITSATKLAAGTEPLVQFLPLPNTDKLMVISRDPSVQSIVRDFINQVDQATGQIRRSRYLYRCQHFEPAQLATLLADTFADRMATSETDPTDTGMRILAENQAELLIVEATPDDYAELMRVIRAVDRAPLQVRIQATILEVALTNELQWGVEYFLEAYSGELGILELTGGTTMPASPTGSAFFVGGSGLALITALARESTVNILSRPEMFISDRGQGKFQVGGETPIVTSDIDSQTQTEGTTGIRRNIEYRDTGVILEIQPRINESGEVRLTIKEEITDVGNETELGPEFTTRLIETDAIVPHGQTLIIGGIIRSEKRNAVEKVPLLGDIPLLGYAFQGIDERETKTELLLAITPTIIRGPIDNRNMVSDFVRSAQGVREALERFAQQSIGDSLLWISPRQRPAEPTPVNGPPEMPELLRSILEDPMSMPVIEEPDEEKPD